MSTHVASDTAEIPFSRVEIEQLLALLVKDSAEELILKLRLQVALKQLDERDSTRRPAEVVKERAYDF